MLIDHSESTSDSELVSIPVEQGQVYYVVVYGYNGATNPAYQMDIIFSHSGDYNGDRLTDAADNVLWRTMLGQAVAPFTGADGSGDGIVGPEDHDLWAANFGHVQAGAGSGAGTSSKVVSPSALAPAVPVVAAPQAAQSAGGGEASDDGFVAGEKLLGIPIASGERALGAVRGARISSGTRVEASDRDAALAAWVASRPSGEQPGGDGVSDTLVTHENGEPDGSLVNALDAAFETLSADAA
jgi:hypothetical protein